MNWLAWKMLTGDTAKYLGIVFGVAFGSLLIAQQSSIFVGLMRRTASVTLDISEPDVWIMDQEAQNVDEIRPLPDSRLYEVRGVPGVAWAVRLFKGQVRVRQDDGSFRQGILIGLDDASLIGAPREMVAGNLSDIRRPDAVFVDKAGYQLLFGNEPIRLGRTLEMNDRRAVITGICEAHAPFQTFPVIYTRYSQATQFVPRERNLLSYILAKPQDDVSPSVLASRIMEETDLKALTSDEFFWFNIKYYLENTGIPVNFGITVALGFIVGAAIAGQTFYLFTIENLKQFGSLKAMGVSNLRIIGMILLQAILVGMMGYGLGIGMSVAFFEATNASGMADLRGMYVPWQVMVITAVSVGFIVIAASLLSIRKVLVLEPAVVFK
jgi:putative ABC transport system permease protein